MNVLKGLKSQESVLFDSGDMLEFNNVEYMEKLDLITHLTYLHLKVIPGFKTKDFEVRVTSEFILENDSIYALDKLISRILKDKSIECIIEQENVMIYDKKKDEKVLLCLK
ncbi:hypothetical protein [Clostridium saudiense]|uniref:hypothetical protein n=1 Tax=Clostridium saudiense TaxID=1414720 RepID=UPI00266EBEF9|nr:hypothetical protein [Clostridium saudiense]